MTGLTPCKIDDIADFLIRHHASHTSPGRAIHCWCIKDPDLKLAVACAPHKDRPKWVEVIAGVILPGYAYTQSRLLSQTIGQLRALRFYDLAYSWDGEDYGPGRMFKAAGWYFAGTYSRTPFAPADRGGYVYWWPLRRECRTMLERLPHP